MTDASDIGSRAEIIAASIIGNYTVHCIVQYLDSIPSCIMLCISLCFHPS